MKKIIIISLLIMSLVLVGCGTERIEYKTQYLELPEGDLLCFTNDDYEERLMEEHNCVFLEKCESDFYDKKCQSLEEMKEYMPEIKGDCT